MLFQERMPVTASMTPPGAGQRSQERERFEPYGESSSLGASARTQASGYDQHLHPLTNNWGQSVVQSAPRVGCITRAKQPHTFYGPARRPSSQQYGQSNPTVSPLQTPLFPLDSHLY
ncbi:unnamed protein product [Prunus brigantina]